MATLAREDKGMEPWSPPDIARLRTVIRARAMWDQMTVKGPGAMRHDQRSVIQVMLICCWSVALGSFTPPYFSDANRPSRDLVIGLRAAPHTREPLGAK